MKDAGNFWIGWRIYLAALLAILIVACFFLLPRDGGGQAGAYRRSQCIYNLRQIGMALANYHETYGSFPPAYIADEKGRPIHSWRVLLLPFLDQMELYKRYRFDEPWNGPRNRLLAETVVSVFSCRDENGAPDGADSLLTSYVAVVDPESVWPGDRPMRISEITDGTSNTLLVVEVANSGIHWMEPRDLHVVQMAQTINPKAGQGISSRHEGGAYVLMCDGSDRFLRESMPGDTLRAMLTAHAGDEVGEF